MYSIDKQVQEEVKEIDIHPISKLKRILVFLADFMIHFILTFILFAVASAPLTSVISKADERGKEMEILEKRRDDILYENKLLFYNSDAGYEKYSYQSNVTFTFNRWLSYYVLDSAIDTSKPYYDHILENEVFFTFYDSIRNNKQAYIDMFTLQNKTGLFDISGDVFTLKDEYKEELKIFFIPGESLGKKGESYKEKLSTTFVLIYREVMKDILKNDLTFDSYSYKESTTRLNHLNDVDKWALTVAILVPFVLSLIILHVVIPCASKTGKTISMMIMKVERVGMNNLFLLKKIDTVLTNIYALFFAFTFLFFIPLTYSGNGIIYVLNLPIIPYVSLFGLILIIVSLFVIIFSHFNRSLSDKMSRSVLIPQGDLEEVYRVKGYMD